MMREPTSAFLIVFFLMLFKGIKKKNVSTESLGNTPFNVLLPGSGGTGGQDPPALVERDDESSASLYDTTSRPHLQSRGRSSSLMFSLGVKSF